MTLTMGNRDSLTPKARYKEVTPARSNMNFNFTHLLSFYEDLLIVI
jgi:hypothetical protein